MKPSQLCREHIQSSLPKMSSCPIIIISGKNIYHKFYPLSNYIIQYYFILTQISYFIGHFFHETFSVLTYCDSTFALLFLLPP